MLRKDIPRTSLKASLFKQEQGWNLESLKPWNFMKNLHEWRAKKKDEDGLETSHERAKKTSQESWEPMDKARISKSGQRRKNMSVRRLMQPNRRRMQLLSQSLFQQKLSGALPFSLPAPDALKDK